MVDVKTALFLVLGLSVRLACGAGVDTTTSRTVQKPVILVGKVVDPEGKPASKVAVCLLPHPQDERPTDAEGRYTLTLATNPEELWREAEGFTVVIARDLDRDLAAAVDVDEATTHANLKLEPGLSLAGQVADAEGKPIPNAEVSVFFMTPRSGSLLGSPRRADAEGRFELKGLPAGRAYNLYVTAKGYGSDNRMVNTADTATRRLDLDPFQLALADQRVAGVVVDAEDKPVKGARLFIFNNGQPSLKAPSDAQGRFSFDHVCAGPIEISADSLFQGSGTAAVEGGDTHITVKLGVHQRLGGRGGARTKILGTVQDPDGKPAPKVLVSLFPFAQDEKTTDAEGRFTLLWDPNQFEGGMRQAQRLVIARDLTRNLAAAFDLEEGVTNADLRLEPAWTLAGRVVDTNGAAIPGALARALLKADRVTSTLGSPSPMDAAGRFEIKGLPIGRGISVQISAPGFGQNTPNADPPQDARRVELEPTELLAADQRIAGVVLDAHDKPVAGAFVNGSGNQQPNVNGQTDAQGRFAFKPVCASPLCLRANTLLGAFGNATVQGGDTNVTIRISANRGGRTPPSLVASLQGKPLPDLAPLGLAPADVPAKQPVLALLIDAEQRPSRRVLHRLTELADTLKKKGLAVVVLEAGAMEGEAFAVWKKENALPFPIGLLKGNRDQARAAWGAAALPWLILTDANRKVIAEGFAPGELEEKLNPADK